MKRFIAMMLAVLMLLSLAACGKQAESSAPAATAAPTEASTVPTTEPAPTEPEWEPGYVRAGDLGAIFAKFQREDTVTVLGEWNGYFVIEGEEADLLVETRFLRPEGEAAPAEKTGWTRANTEVFPSGYLMGEPIATLGQNTQVRVLDTKANWAYIQWNENTGYVDALQISDWRIGGGNAGGSSGGSKGPQDGTDVYVGQLSAASADNYGIVRLGTYSGPAYEKYDKSLPGMILSAETEAYRFLMVRGDEAKVLEAGEEFCTILAEEETLQIPRWAVRLEGDEEYTSWTAYIKAGSKACTEYQMVNEWKTFQNNDQILVVDYLEEIGIYVVEVEGEFGYMLLESLSETTFPAPYAGNGGGGYTGGSSSGGSGSSGGSSSGWTPIAK